MMTAILNWIRACREKAPPKAGTYRCAMCDGVFDLAEDETWSTEKAKAELKERFGDIPASDCDMVCDDCYGRMMGGTR